MKTLLKTIGLTSVLFVLSGISRADTIIDTGPGSIDGPTYLLGGGSIDQQLAGQFELNSATQITSIMGWITTGTVFPWDIGVGGQLNISILSDLSTSPGTTLFSGSTNLAGQLDYDWYGLSGLNWVLDAGTYWVAFGSPDGNPTSGNPQFGYMQGNPSNPLDRYSARNSIFNHQWVNSSSVGIKITGNVPDQSSTLPLLGLALAGLLYFRQRS